MPGSRPAFADLALVAGDRGVDARRVRLQPVYRRAGALGAAQDRSRADARGAAHAGARDPHAGDRDPAGRAGLRRARCSIRSARTSAIMPRSTTMAGTTGWLRPTSGSHRHRPSSRVSNCRRRPDARRQPLPPQLQGPGRGSAGRCSRARARAASTAMLNISTRESEWDDVVATAEREPDVWATIGIHPHEADAHPDVDAAKLIERARHPRVVGLGESGLDYYLRHVGSRPPAGELSRAYRRVARDRAADRRPHPRCRGRYRRDHGRGNGEGGLSRRHPLLHRERSFRRQGAGHGPLYLDLGYRHLQERTRSAGDRRAPADRAAADRDRRAVPRAGAASRQDRASPPSSPTRRDSWPTCAARMSRNCRAVRPRISTRCSARRAQVKITHPRIGHVVRRAADRQRLGRLRSCRTAQPPHARVRAGRA